MGEEERLKGGKNRKKLIRYFWSVVLRGRAQPVCENFTHCGPMEFPRYRLGGGGRMVLEWRDLS